MTASLSPIERERIRGFIAALQCAPKSRSNFWMDLIVRALADGPATRRELMYAVGARLRSPSDRKAVERAIQALLQDGVVRERDELTPARGIRVFNPVRVLELAAEPG